MPATAISKKTNPPFARVRRPRRVSWEQFERKYLLREDSWKYEWVDGFVEKTKRVRNQYQIRIATNLLDFFYGLKMMKKVSGSLMPETDTFFLEKIHRRPDIAYFSDEQLANIDNGNNQAPEFVIEVISTKDVVNTLQRKMKNYRDADVKVVWQIFPELEEVHVYRGETMCICSGEKLCSAAPVLPDFALSAKDVFKKPA